jgi:hypothetical protein
VLRPSFNASTALRFNGYVILPRDLALVFSVQSVSQPVCDHTQSFRCRMPLALSMRSQVCARRMGAMILTGDRVIEAFPAGAMTLRLWWAIPGVLAGTSMPLLHRERHDYRKSALDAYRDDLPLLYRAGIRAIVCLLDFPSLAQIYSSAGFAVHMMPVADGDVPRRSSSQASCNSSTISGQ